KENRRIIRPQVQESHDMRADPGGEFLSIFRFPLSVPLPWVPRRPKWGGASEPCMLVEILQRKRHASPNAIKHFLGFVILSRYVQDKWFDAITVYEFMVPRKSGKEIMPGIDFGAANIGH